MKNTTVLGVSLSVWAMFLLASVTVEISLARPLSSDGRLKQALLTGREEGSVKVGKNTASHLISKRQSKEKYYTPNYSEVSFRLRNGWRSGNCTGEFNCGPVTPLHCKNFENRAEEYLTTDTYSVETLGCQLEYSISVEEGRVAEGAELALFKKKEQKPAGHLSYYTFIAYKHQNEPNYSRFFGGRHISWSCNSWQVFDLTDVKGELPSNQVHNISLLIATFKETQINQQYPPILSCQETKNLFVIDTNVNVEEYINGEQQQQPVTDSMNVEEQVMQKDATLDTTEGEDGKNKSYNDLHQSLGEGNKSKSEMGSGGGEGGEKMETPTESMNVEEQVVQKDVTLNTTEGVDGKKKSYNDLHQSLGEGNKSKSEMGSGGGEGGEKMETPTEPAPAYPPQKYLPTFVLFTSGSTSSFPPFKRSVVEQVSSNNKNFTEVKPDSDLVSAVDCQRYEDKVLAKELNPTFLAPEYIDLGRCSNTTNVNGIECLPSETRHPEVITIIEGTPHIIRVSDIVEILKCTARNTTVTTPLTTAPPSVTA